MEAPAVVRKRESNFFTLMPADVRNLIAGYLNARQFALLGGCSYHLNQYVKKATQIWKRLYLQDYPHVNRDEVSDCREKVMRRGLIKRNMAAGNGANSLNHFYFEIDISLFCHGKLYIAQGSTLTCFNKQGKCEGQYYSPNKTHFTLQCFSDVVLASATRFLLVKIPDYEFTIENFSRILGYGDDQFIYKDAGTVPQIHLYNLKLKTDRILKNFNQNLSLIGIHQHLIFAQTDRCLLVDDRERGTRDIYDSHAFTHYYKVAFPFIFFIYSQQALLTCFSCETKTFIPIPHYGKVVSNGTHTYLVSPGEIFEWSSVERQFFRFSIVAEPEQLHILGNTLVAIWKFQVLMWNTATRDTVKGFKLPGGERSYINDNILYHAIPGGVEFWDLSNGKQIGTFKGTYPFILADDGSMVYARFESQVKQSLYTLRDFTQPLPPLTAMQKIGKAANTFFTFFKGN